MEKDQKNLCEESHCINYNFDLQTLTHFSIEIFSNKIFGIFCGLYLNFIYIHNWLKNKNIFSLLIIIYINILIIKIILRKIFQVKINEEPKKNFNEQDLNKIRERFRKIISLEDPSSTIRNFIYTFLCLFLSNLLGDKFIIFFMLNIFVFYAPINNKFPNFVFNSIMYVKQTIEGIFGIVECFIPRYVDKKEKNN